MTIGALLGSPCRVSPPARALGRSPILVLCLGLATGVPHATVGQDAPSGESQAPNPLLTFNISQQVSVARNPDLSPGDNEFQASALTDLGLLLSSSTPLSTLSLAADTSLSFGLLAEDAIDTLDFGGPAIALNYERAVPSASFEVEASYNRDDIASLRDLSDFVEDDGSIDLPDDFEDLQGEGTRQSLDLDATLSLRDNRPFGVELSAAVTSVSYEDVTSENLADSSRAEVGVGLRFSLTDVTELRADTRLVHYQEDGAEAYTQLGFALNGSIEQRDGRTFAMMSLDETDDGVRAGLSFGREIQRPLGGLSGQIGLTSDLAGDLLLTYDVEAIRSLRNQTLVVALNQSVGAADEGGEELSTTFSAGWNRNLTPLTSLGLDALYSDLRDLETNESVRNLEVGIALSRQLTSDWSLSVAYRHGRRDETGTSTADSDSLSLSLGRRFVSSF